MPALPRMAPQRSAPGCSSMSRVCNPSHRTSVDHSTRSVATLKTLLVVALLAMAPWLAPSADAATLGADRVFGLSGQAFRDFRPIPQWQGVLERYREEAQKDTRCRQGTRGDCPYTQWLDVIERLRRSDRLAQLKEINRFANRWRYVADFANWGVEDYWATPGEFFDRSGDCEDYAIVKFLSLRALGFSNDELLLVAVQDENLDIGHAVTLASVNGETFVLDNQVEQVIPSTRVRHYRPVFSANEVSWWLYRSR